MQKLCRLCQIGTDLKRSHLIPKFVYSWHRESSPAYLRAAIKPNVRIQDGYKSKLLCGKCENLISAWENLFYGNIFKKYHADSASKYPLEYREWALKFCVSLSWRALIYLYDLEPKDFTKIENDNILACLESWRKFILGESDNPGKYEQHLLPLDLIKGTSIDSMSPFINRYLMTTTDVDLLRSNKDIIVYVKMFKIIIFGIVEISKPNNWVGMKIHVHKGDIGGTKNYKIPIGIINYINERASMCLDMKNKLSSNQKSIIAAHINNNIDNYIGSDVHKAFYSDLSQYGKDAIGEVDET